VAPGGQYVVDADSCWGSDLAVRLQAAAIQLVPRCSIAESRIVLNDGEPVTRRLQEHTCSVGPL
jgi:hypothetical protein